MIGLQIERLGAQTDSYGVIYSFLISACPHYKRDTARRDPNDNNSAMTICEAPNMQFSPVNCITCELNR